MGALVAVAESPQDVAGLQRSRRAGAARRQRNVLQRHQQRLALNIGKGHVDAAGVEGVFVAILARVLQGKEALEQAVRQSLDSLRVILYRGVSG